MKLRFLLLCILIGSVFSTVAQEAQLNKADSLLIEVEAAACLKILRSLDSIARPDIAFRVKLLEAIIAGTSNEETVANIESIRSKYRKADFSNLVKVTYLNYFSEIMIPDDNWNAYNLTFLDTVLNIYDESVAKDSFMLMHMLHNKGNLLHKLNQHDKAIEALRKSVDIAEKIDTRNPSLLAIIIFNLANPYYSIGKFQKSYEIVERSAQLLSSLENPNRDYFQTVHLDLFSSSLDFGNLEKAENYLNKAARLYDSMKETMTSDNKDAKIRKEISLLYSYMRLYSAKGDFTKALENLSEAQRKFGNEESPYMRLRLAAINNIMGDMYVKDQPEKSFRFFQKAIEIYDKEDLTYSLMFEFNLGKAYLNSKQYDKSAEIAKSLIAKATPAKDHRLPFYHSLDAKRSLLLNQFSNSLPALNALANAVNKSTSKIDLLTQQGVDNFSCDENIDLGYLLSESAEVIEKNIEQGQESYTVMNSLWRLAIINFQSTFKKAQFNEKSQRQYEIMLNGLLKTDEYLGRSAMAFEDVIKFSENSTSRVLWEQFKLKNQGLELEDQSLRVEEQKLRSEFTALKKRMKDADSLEVNREIFEVELALEKVDLEKREKNNSFYKYEDFTFDLTEFRERLSKDDLVLKYEYLDSILYVYEITSEAQEIRRIDSLTRIDGNVKRFAQLLRDPSSEISEIQELGQKIALQLLPSVLKENILIVSDGVLNYLPFDLLSKNGDFLVESHTISNTTSLSLLDISTADNNIKSSLIVAPSYEDFILSSQQLAVRGEAYNLDGALVEAEKIAKIIPTERWTRELALKETFIDRASEFDLLHLSMHSFMNDEDPELSSLVFHDSESGNELYISELYGLDLNAKLAVLSACNTGVGKEQTGEGMVSVNRAFTYAGVPSVVSSLWSAPDQATQQLMTHFYGALKAGETKSQALRNAKLTYLNEQKIDKLKHPYFWGGFVLHGNKEALEFTGLGRGSKMMLWLAGLLLLILSMLVFRKWSSSRS